MSKRIAVLISGGGTNLQCLIDGVKAGEIKGEISLVISDRKGVYGLERARGNNIPNLYINKKEFNSLEDYNSKILDLLDQYKIDLIVLAGYLSIVSKEIIEGYRHRIVNIHPSLIPSFCGKGYYGDKVHRAVLEYGVKVTGATTHFVDESTDTGPIIMQQPVYIGDLDKVEDIQSRVLEVEHQILKESVSLFCQDRLLVQGRKVCIRE